LRALNTVSFGEEESPTLTAHGNTPHFSLSRARFLRCRGIHREDSIVSGLMTCELGSVFTSAERTFSELSSCRSEVIPQKLTTVFAANVLHKCIQTFLVIQQLASSRLCIAKFNRQITL
jgi:hypothetical protein